MENFTPLFASIFDGNGIYWSFGLLLQILFAHLIAHFLGSQRTIGYWGSFIISFIFTPLIGLIVTILFPRR